jgi:putative ATPase
LSRSRIFRFHPLTDDQVRDLLRRALADVERGYGDRKVEVSDEALDHLALVAAGDARSALNALELAVESTPLDGEGARRIDLDAAAESIQQRVLQYDRQGDQHYNVISAFIKSIRGSDPDAALYYLAVMVKAGEDPRFILRRLLILAAEDVGLASPMAVAVVNACAQAFEWVGMPEGQYHLAEAALYLATTPKSNSVGAYWRALEEVEEHGASPPPVYLRDERTLLREEKERAPGYKYPHDYPTGWVRQRYLPEGVEGDWFQPKGHGYEKRIIDTLEQLKDEK